VACRLGFAIARPPTGEPHPKEKEYRSFKGSNVPKHVLVRRYNETRQRRDFLSARNRSLAWQLKQAQKQLEQARYEGEIIRTVNLDLTQALQCVELEVQSHLAMTHREYKKTDNWRIVIADPRVVELVDRYLWHCELCGKYYRPPLEYSWAIMACPHPGSPHPLELQVA
jgi:hypothetical protein